MFKSGFVSIVGRPNVGKSTLMNNVVGEKIAIMSDKPQTTRNTIQAVYTDEEMQIVFLDTPGIHKPKNKLGEFMVKAATEAFKNVDLILFVVDDSKKIGPGDRKIIEDLRSVKTPIILVVNKIDQLDQKDELFDIIKMYDREGIFKEIVPISALKGKNTDTLIKVIQNYLEEGIKNQRKRLIARHFRYGTKCDRVCFNRENTRLLSWYGRCFRKCFTVRFVK